MSVEVSVVLPSYNEEATIERTVEKTLDRLSTFLPEASYEVIIAEDGCDDLTPEIAARMAREDPRVRHAHSDERLGRGGALERAFRFADGSILAYMDTDLATDLSHLEELIESVRSGEYDVATGSRWIPGDVVDRPMKRSVPSRGFNGLVRLLLGSEIRDHQCGFKAFDRAVLFDLIDKIGDEHWFWDTELLTRAQRQGYRVQEFPVEWTPNEETKVDLVRDVFGMGSQTLRCWWEFSIQPRITTRRTIVGGTLLVVVALLLMTQYIDPTVVMEEIVKTDPMYIGAAMIVYLLSWPLRGLRYRDILTELGYTERTGFLTGAVFISQTGNLVIPARIGDGLRAYVVKMRRDIPYTSGFASLAVERVFDLLTIAVLASVVFVGLIGMDLNIAKLGAGSESGIKALVTAAGVGSVAVIVAVVIVLSARSDRNLVRAGIGYVSSDTYADYVAGVLERFTGDVQRVASDPKSFVRIGGESVLIWSMDVATALLVFAAFDISLDPVTFIAVGFFAVSVGNLAKVLPLSPGGVGLYEGAFILIVTVFTPIGPAVATSAAIVDHALKNIVTVLGGIVSTLVLNVSLINAVEESREIDATDSETVSTD